MVYFSVNTEVVALRSEPVQWVGDREKINPILPLGEKYFAEDTRAIKHERAQQIRFPVVDASRTFYINPSPEGRARLSRISFSQTRARAIPWG